MDHHTRQHICVVLAIAVVAGALFRLAGLKDGQATEIWQTIWVAGGVVAALVYSWAINE